MCGIFCDGWFRRGRAFACLLLPQEKNVFPSGWLMMKLPRELPRSRMGSPTHRPWGSYSAAPLASLRPGGRHEEASRPLAM